MTSPVRPNKPATYSPSAASGRQPESESPIYTLLRALGVLILLGFCALLLLSPKTGLFLFWRVLGPLIPISMALMPDLWRKVNPINVIGMLPQRLGIGGKTPMPAVLQRHGILIGIGLFLLTIPSRDIILNSDATALALFILGILALVLLESVLFKRPDGCNNFCPLLPLQRILAPQMYNAYADPQQRSYNLFLPVPFRGWCWRTISCHFLQSMPSQCFMRNSRSIYWPASVRLLRYLRSSKRRLTVLRRSTPAWGSACFTGSAFLILWTI